MYHRIQADTDMSGVAGERQKQPPGTGDRFRVILAEWTGGSSVRNPRYLQCSCCSCLVVVGAVAVVVVRSVFLAVFGAVRCCCCYSLVVLLFWSLLLLVDASAAIFLVLVFIAAVVSSLSVVVLVPALPWSPFRLVWRCPGCLSV